MLLKAMVPYIAFNGSTSRLQTDKECQGAEILWKALCMRELQFGQINRRQQAAIAVDSVPPAIVEVYDNHINWNNTHFSSGC